MTPGSTITEFALAEWWGLVDGDPLLVGIVVAAIILFALVYIVGRVRKGRD